MGTEGSSTSKETKAKLDYLKELLTDRTTLSSYPGQYIHVAKILEKEILQVRTALFATYGIYTITDKDLPEPDGPKVNLQTKVYMPIEGSGSFNFVGRILGPDGSTAKCLQQCLGVKIMVRGRGSMRDRKKEEANVGKPNWEHLNDNLHVVLNVEDYENRAKARLAKASEYISMFLKESMKASDREDRVKQMQLMELSFRRERPTWHWNYNGLLDMALPQKPGTLFPSPNLLGYGYGYPPPPLFPPIHHNAHHFGSLQHPSNPLSGPASAAAAAAQANHLASFTHSFPSPLSSNLSAALLMSQTTPNGFSSPYGPASQLSHPSNAPPPAIPGALAVASLNYWPPSAALSQLSTDYSHLSTSTPASQNGTAANGFNPPSQENGPVDRVPSNQVNLTNAAPVSISCTPQGTLNQVFLQAAQQPQLSRLQDDHLQSGVLADFSTCSVGSNLANSKEQEAHIQPGVGLQLPGLYGPMPPPSKLSSRKLPAPLHINPPNSVPGCSLPTKQHGGKQRYSQRHHNSQFGSHQVTGSTTHSGRGGRAAVVTVKVGAAERPTPPVSKSADNVTVNNGLQSCNGDTTPTLNGSRGLKPSSVSSSPKLTSSNAKSTPTSKTDLARVDEKNTVSPVTPINPGTLDADDLDWPKLTAVCRDKTNGDLQAQNLATSPVAHIDQQLLGLSLTPIDSVSQSSSSDEDLTPIISSPALKSAK
ncbi:unnamed protein product [Calicophoron daubneyi]|uniref:Uncharacterized protein n=1 Tax=Calicophoron daubneyi TaxID=300641 RepID=A0AAV2T1B3_CALDB